MLKQIKKYISLIFLGLLFSCTKNVEVGKEQADTFVKYFGGSADDIAMDLSACDDGGYAITGQLSASVYGTRACFIRTDQYGNELGFSPVILGNGNASIGHHLCKTKDGGFLVVGSIVVTGRTDKDVLLVKVKDNGTIVWTKTISGLKEDEGFSVSELASGNILVGGYTEIVGRNKDAWAILLNSSGTKLWDKTYGAGNDDIGNDIFDDTNNYLNQNDTCFLLTGSTKSYQFANLKQNIFLVKIIRKSGIAIDFVYYGGDNDEYGVKSVVGADNCVYVLANSQSSTSSTIHLLKLKSDFHQVVWEKYLPSSNSEVGNDIILNNGQIIIIGSSGSDPNTDFLMDVLDTDGNELNPNSNTIQALGNQVGMTGIIGSDGRLIIAGSNQVQGFSKIALIKTDFPK